MEDLGLGLVLLALVAGLVWMLAGRPRIGARLWPARWRRDRERSTTAQLSTASLTTRAGADTLPPEALRVQPLRAPAPAPTPTQASAAPTLDEALPSAWPASATDPAGPAGTEARAEAGPDTLADEQAALLAAYAAAELAATSPPPTAPVAPAVRQPTPPARDTGPDTAPGVLFAPPPQVERRRADAAAVAERRAVALRLAAERRAAEEAERAAAEAAASAAIADAQRLALDRAAARAAAAARAQAEQDERDRAAEQARAAQARQAAADAAAEREAAAREAEALEAQARAAAQRAAAARAAAEQAAAERAAALQAAQEHAAQERAAALERAAAERAAAEQAAAERAAAQRAAELRAAELRAAEQQAAERRAAEAAAASAPPPAAAAARPRSPEDVLVMIADDSKVVRVKTSRLLAKHGYRVALAEDGADALRQFDTELPQLLITDVEMPGMDGFELTRQVRGQARTATLPIIMITSADDRLRDPAAQAGVTVLMGKPYADDELLAQIAQHAGVALHSAA